jgi:hypothetical protein
MGNKAVFSNIDVNIWLPKNGRKLTDNLNSSALLEQYPDSYERFQYYVRIIKYSTDIFLEKISFLLFANLKPNLLLSIDRSTRLLHSESSHGKVRRSF